MNKMTHIESWQIEMVLFQSTIQIDINNCCSKISNYVRKFQHKLKKMKSQCRSGPRSKVSQYVRMGLLHVLLELLAVVEDVPDGGLVDLV